MHCHDRLANLVVFDDDDDNKLSHRYAQNEIRHTAQINGEPSTNIIRLRVSFNKNIITIYGACVWACVLVGLFDCMCVLFVRNVGHKNTPQTCAGRRSCSSCASSNNASIQHYHYIYVLHEVGSTRNRRHTHLLRLCQHSIDIN